MRSQVFRSSAARSTSSGERSALAPFTMRMEFSPEGSTMIGATPLDLPGTRRTCFVSMPRPSPGSFTVVVGEHVVADRRHHDDGRGEPSGGDGLVRALAAVAHLEARHLYGLAAHRHPMHIGHKESTMLLPTTAIRGPWASGHRPPRRPAAILALLLVFIDVDPPLQRRKRARTFPAGPPHVRAHWPSGGGPALSRRAAAGEMSPRTLDGGSPSCQ